MQTLVLLLLMGAGVLTCVLAIGAVTVRWRLPWREALTYFGILSYPHERPLPRPRARRPA